ncbi:hypothetical protein LB543_27705 [Mesorhizobium sp. ESP7-2]|uniref:hypothetical protein n=1 Tax=Mesorhizobium sp. ESP7-2 TaxID=2876622 RepID=UPI001CCBDB3F|nr:hypothetical protein [Mesorhizobium sp. ESP7-2]MBZ9710489.1 hypothetical protein [Mesorhizobium sp. ESP7-2]
MASETQAQSKAERQKTNARLKAQHLAGALPDDDDRLLSKEDKREGEKLLRWIGTIDRKISKLEKQVDRTVQDPDVTAASFEELSKLNEQRRDFVKQLVTLGAKPALTEFVTENRILTREERESVAKFLAEAPRRRRLHLASIVPRWSQPGGLVEAPALLKQIDGIDETIRRLEQTHARKIDSDHDVLFAIDKTLPKLKAKRSRLVRQMVELSAGLSTKTATGHDDDAAWPGDDEDDTDEEDAQAERETFARKALTGLLAKAGVKHDAMLTARQMVEIVAVPMAMALERQNAHQELIDRLDVVAKRLDEIERHGIKFQGTWQRACDYTRGSVVVQGGSSWVATKDVSAGDAPPGSSWALMAKAGRDKSGRGYETRDMSGLNSVVEDGE